MQEQQGTSAAAVPRRTVADAVKVLNQHLPGWKTTLRVSENPQAKSTEKPPAEASKPKGTKRRRTAGFDCTEGCRDASFGNQELLDKHYEDYDHTEIDVVGM